MLRVCVRDAGYVPRPRPAGSYLFLVCVFVASLVFVPKTSCVLLHVVVVAAVDDSTRTLSWTRRDVVVVAVVGRRGCRRGLCRRFGRRL